MKATVPSGIGSRLAEKTVELTFASQVGSQVGPCFWFGLTQAQEAAEGYDAALSVGARLVYFQFKVSNRVLTSGVRQFRLAHVQLEALRALRPPPRTVFYVLPDVGTHDELSKRRWDLLDECWYLDVTDIPAALAPPTTNSGTLRASGYHYGDLDVKRAPPQITLHSEPTTAHLMSTGVLFGEELRRRYAPADNDRALFVGLRARLTRHAVALALL